MVGQACAAEQDPAQPARLVEVVVDFALISASFTIAYLLFVDGSGTDYQKHIFLVSLPAILAARYLCFIPAGLYSGVWRFAGAREAAAIVVAVIVSEGLAYAIVWFTSRPFGDFPQRIYVLDALIAMVLVGSRFAERVVFRARDVPRPARPPPYAARRRGRSGRSLLRELRRRRASTSWASWTTTAGCAAAHAGRARARHAPGDRPRPRPVAAGRRARDDPAAPRDLLDGVVQACERAQVPCRFVRRDLDLDPVVALGAAVE